MQEALNRVDWEKIELLPVIVQEVSTNEVLMMAYMNREALELSLTTRVAHYFSRSKQRICLLYTSPSPRDPHVSRMPSSA